MKELSYHSEGSTPLAAVMVGLVALGGQISQESEQITPNLCAEYGSDKFVPYMACNAGTSIRVLSHVTGDLVVDKYRPRTELGRRLLALRRAYIDSGGRLLDGDEICEEAQSRRGGSVVA